MARTASPARAIADSDRLSFPLFLAAVLHGLVIFGVAFELSQPGDNAPSVTVTLTTAESAKEPEKADFIAQANQTGSGTLDEARQITTAQLSPFSSQTIKPTQLLQETRAAVPERVKTRIVTAANAATFTPDHEDNPRQTNQSDGTQGRDIRSLTREIASLNAKLARQRQQYANRPRERVLTSVSAKASRDAAYLNEWTRKIELTGNENFPQEAIRQKITGNLRLQSVIKWDGSLIKAEILESSGHRILDDAALRIVRRSAPFLPFPPEIRKDTDQLVIIRTWYFDITGLLTAQ